MREPNKPERNKITNIVRRNENGNKVSLPPHISNRHTKMSHENVHEEMFVVRVILLRSCKVESSRDECVNAGSA